MVHLSLELYTWLPLIMSPCQGINPVALCYEEYEKKTLWKILPYHRFQCPLEDIFLCVERCEHSIKVELIRNFCSTFTLINVAYLSFVEAVMNGRVSHFFSLSFISWRQTDTWIEDDPHMGDMVHDEDGMVSNVSPFYFSTNTLSGLSNQFCIITMIKICGTS